MESPGTFRMDALERAVTAISSRVDAADSDRSRLTDAITQLSQSNAQLSTLIRTSMLEPMAGQPQRQPPRILPIERPLAAAAGPPTPGKWTPPIQPQQAEPPARGSLPIPAWVQTSAPVAQTQEGGPSLPQARDGAPPTIIQRDTAAPKSRNFKSWADIAARPLLPALDPAMQHRITSTGASLAQSGFAPLPQASNPLQTPLRPEPVAFYFAGVPRGPVGAFRRLILGDHSLPRWALPAISFAGIDRVEIPVHRPLIDCLTAVMQLLGYRHLRDHDPTLAHGSDREESRARGRASRAARACAIRWYRCSASTRGVAAKNWYVSAVQAICKTHPDLVEELQEIAVPTVAAGGSGGQTEPSLRGNETVSPAAGDRATTKSTAPVPAGVLRVSCAGTPDEEATVHPREAPSIEPTWRLGGPLEKQVDSEGFESVVAPRGRRRGRRRQRQTDIQQVRHEAGQTGEHIRASISDQQTWTDQQRRIKTVRHGSDAVVGEQPARLDADPPPEEHPNPEQPSASNAEITCIPEETTPPDPLDLAMEDGSEEDAHALGTRRAPVTTPKSPSEFNRAPPARCVVETEKAERQGTPQQYRQDQKKWTVTRRHRRHRPPPPHDQLEPRALQRLNNAWKSIPSNWKI